MWCSDLFSDSFSHGGRHTGSSVVLWLVLWKRWSFLKTVLCDACSCAVLVVGVKKKEKQNKKEASVNTEQCFQCLEKSSVCLLTTWLIDLIMQPHYHSCKQWHVRGPRVQQYLLYSNIHLNIIVYVIKTLLWLSRYFFLFLCGSNKIHLTTPGSCSGEDTCRSLLSGKKTNKQKKRQNAVGRVRVRLCVWAERDPGAFTYCARYKKKKTRTSITKENLQRSLVYLQMLSYTQLFWTENPVTSCSTSLVTLTWSRSHLQKKKKKKISIIVYIFTWQM